MASYQDLILKHSQKPFGFEIPPHLTHSKEGYNALCGDKVTIYVDEHKGAPFFSAFQSEGCALCRASASIMMQELRGRTWLDASNFLQEILGNLAARQILSSPPWSKDLEALSDMRRFPSRLRCVLLPWETMEKILIES